MSHYFICKAFYFIFLNPRMYLLVLFIKGFNWKLDLKKKKTENKNDSTG